MGEVGRIALSFIAIGLLFLVVGSLYPGSDASWNGFRDTLSGQTFPVFTNPFASGGFTANVPIGQQTFYWQYPTYANTTSTNGCNNVSYYRCVTDPGGPDLDSTYIQMRNFNGPLPDFNSSFLATMDLGLRATSVDWTRFAGFGLSVYCRGVDRSFSLQFEVLQQLTPTSQQVTGAKGIGTCPQSSTFVRIDMSNSTVPSPPTDANADMTLQVQILGNPLGSWALDISTVIFSGYFQANAQCTGNGFFGDLSCQIGNLFRPVVNAIGFFVGGIIFIGSVIWFGLNLLYLVLIGITGQMAFFFALPNTPPFVQAALDAALLGIIALIFITVAQIVRGSASG